jgi:hypothetical protein
MTCFSFSLHRYREPYIIHLDLRRTYYCWYRPISPLLSFNTRHTTRNFGIEIYVFFYGRKYLKLVRIELLKYDTARLWTTTTLWVNDHVSISRKKSLWHINRRFKIHSDSFAWKRGCKAFTTNSSAKFVQILKLDRVNLMTCLLAKLEKTCVNKWNRYREYFDMLVH